MFAVGYGPDRDTSNDTTGLVVMLDSAAGAPR